MSSRPSLRVFVLAGFVIGLAWTSALRAYMSEVAGFASRVEWVATFAQILLPGVLMFIAFAVAEYFRRTGGRTGWRWLAAAPVLLTIAPLLSPGAVVTLLTTGVGGGALAIPLAGVLGGFAVSGRGPIWARIVAGVPVGAFIVAGSAAFFFLDPLVKGPTEPRGVWIGLLFASLMVIFVVACSVPHRPVVVSPTPDDDL